MKVLTEEEIDKLPKIDDGLEQLLLICIKLSDNDMGNDLDDEYVEGLEMDLIQMVDGLDFARYDGHEWGGGFSKIYIYTNEVDRLYKHLFKKLKAFSFTPGSHIILNYDKDQKEFFCIDPTKQPD